MGLTLTQLRREIGQDIGECVVGVVDAGSTNSIQDDDLLDIDASDTEYDHAWIRVYWVDGAGELYDQTRRVRITNHENGVEGYDPHSGTIVVSRPWTFSVPADSYYEIHKLIDPTQLDRLILNGVRRCSYTYLLSLDAVDDQRVYDLSSYTWLTNPVQVVDVTYVSDPTDIDETTRQPLTWWQVNLKDDGGLELHIRPQETDTGDDLYLTCIRPHGDSLSTAGGEDMDERWAKAAAMVEVYTYLIHNAPSQDTDRYAKHLSMWAARFTEQSRVHGPTRSRALVRLGDTPRN